MHLGNIYSALLSWLSVRSQGGCWVLRIEDLDPQRSRRAFAEQIEDDLRWLGLNWDEGGLTRSSDDSSSQRITAESSFVQSERGGIYSHYLNILTQEGLTYPCYCTRADIMATQAPHEADGRIVYAGTCRPKSLVGNLAWENADNHPSGRKPAARLVVPDEEISFVDAHYGPQSVNLARHCGDFVLRRADGAWAYQLAVVVDDALMGITEVVRGRDLLLSAPQQIYLYRLLGFPVPTFCHLPLLCNLAGQRLCKRDKSLDLGEIRKAGHAPARVIGQLACYAGIIDHPESVSAQELVSEFSWDKVPIEDIRVNPDFGG